MKRKLLLLFALMAVGLSHTWAYQFSAVAPTGQTLYYNIVNGNAEVTYQSTYPRYNSLSGALVIPATVTYYYTTYSVTAIGDHAFAGCSDLTSVTIPNSVTTIGDYAFQSCFDLTSVTIPNSVTAIGNYAFSTCLNLTSITIPNSVSSIGYQTFAGCGFTSVTIPNSVTSIGNSAFIACHDLMSVDIPNSVTSIGNYAFSNCSSLTSVTIPNSVTSIGNYAFSNCDNLSSVTIGNSVTSIDYSAFIYCNGLTSLIVIGDNTHYDSRDGCNAIIETSSNTLILGCQNTIIPNSVTTIGNHAFSSCNGLTNVTIPNSVTTIGDCAFESCYGLMNVTIGNSVATIGDYAFYECYILTSITIGAEEVPAMGSAVFYNVPTSIPVYVPCDKVSAYQEINGWSQFTNIQEDPSCLEPHYDLYYTFNGTSATVYGSAGDGRVAIANSGTLEELDIPSTVTYNGNTYSVTSIGDEAFRGCSSLTSVTIPNSVTDIGQLAFYGTTLYNNNDNWTNGVLYISNCLLKAKSNELPSSYSIANNTKLIAYGAFAGCSRLASVTIPNSVTTIGNYAFSSCSGIFGSVTVPNSVTTIGEGAFMSCINIGSVIIGNSVTSIGENAFYGCWYLVSVIVDNGNTRYDSRNGCNAIIETSSNTLIFGCQNTFIPNSVTAIGDYAFADCLGLQSIAIPNSVTTIGAGAFMACSGLQSIAIPHSVTTIGAGAFSGLWGITLFNLTDIYPFTKTTYGEVLRVVKCDNYGAGDNAIHRIPNTFSVIPGDYSEDWIESHIPASVIPDNFIYQDNGAWKAKNIVLVDDTCRFFSPVAFTADQVTYTRDLTDGNRSTLCLPFDADKPDGLDVYTFAGFENSTQTSAGTIRFQELQGSELTAYTPYLVGKNLSKSTTKFTFSKQNADFPATPSPIATSTINGLTFHGTMNRECMNSSNYGYKDGYFVQSSAGTQGDHTSHAHVNPFRCFFTLSGNQSAPATLSVDTDGDYLGIEDVDSDMEQTSIRYSNDVYDMMGRLVRKDAESLRGLPRGIYIWRGKKQIAY